jgi:DNA adenine methylase
MLFRYPGAKNKLIRYCLDKYLDKIIDRTEIFHDVFVGGGSVSIYVASRMPDICIYMNDSDETISGFWSLIARNNKNEISEFLDRLNIVPTIEMFLEKRLSEVKDEIDLAFRAVFFNRTTFSGISKASPIGGKEQDGKWKVNCRYNYRSINNEILYLCNLFKGRLIVESLPVCEYLMNHKGPMYLDPPYYHKGAQLYPKIMTIEDHVHMSNMIKSTDRWVLSYDSCREVTDLYSWANIERVHARYSITGSKKKSEVLAGRDGWISKEELIITPR